MNRGGLRGYSDLEQVPLVTLALVRIRRSPDRRKVETGKTSKSCVSIVARSCTVWISCSSIRAFAHESHLSCLFGNSFSRAIRMGMGCDAVQTSHYVLLLDLLSYVPDEHIQPDSRVLHRQKRKRTRIRRNIMSASSLINSMAG